MRSGFVAILAVAGFCVVGLLGDTADARPKYLGAFGKTYAKQVGDEVKKVKCGVCHPEKSKKVKNAYGMAFGKNLPMKNTKDTDAIVEALKKAEGEKNAAGKTYGEVIESGKLPGAE